MKTDWKDDIFTQRKIRLTENSDGTVTPEDATEYTQRGDSFGAKELNEIGTEINEVKKSVSDGKAEIAAAITLKRVATAATATFHQMAENIKKIVLGSGNAQPADVRKGKTFTNDEGVEKAGTMPEYTSGTKGTSCGLNYDGLFYHIGSGYWMQDEYGEPWVYMSRDEVAATIGLNPDCMLDSINVLGKQGKITSMAGQTVTPSNAQQTVNCAWKRMTGNIVVPGFTMPPANAIKKGYTLNMYGQRVTGTFEGWVDTETPLYVMGTFYPLLSNRMARIDFPAYNLEYRSDNIYFSSYIRTSDRIDLTGYRYVQVNFQSASNKNKKYISVGEDGTRTPLYDSNKASLASNLAVGTIRLNVSELSGYFYIKMGSFYENENDFSAVQDIRLIR